MDLTSKIKICRWEDLLLNLCLFFKKTMTLQSVTIPKVTETLRRADVFMILTYCLLNGAITQQLSLTPRLKSSTNDRISSHVAKFPSIWETSQVSSLNQRSHPRSDLFIIDASQPTLHLNWIGFLEVSLLVLRDRVLFRSWIHLTRP